MNKLNIRIFVLGMLTFSISVFSQNVGINNNGAAPNNNAILDVDVTTNDKGILIPRLTTAQRTGIGGLGVGDEGLTVYDETTNSYWLWDGTQWVEFSMGGAGWLINGNANTTAGTNFVGTTNGQALDFRTNNTLRFRVANGNQVQANANGTTGAPFYSWVSDPDVGMWRSTTNRLNFSTAGSERLELGTTEAVFNDISANYDFRIESNGQQYQFFVDAGNDRIGIRTNTPAYMLQMTNGGQAVGAAAMASFENQTAGSGVALSGYNTGTTNGYNGIEGITSYSGNGFIPSGVFGLAISGTLTHRAIGVRGAANGRDGVGVRGSRQNTGGIVGWGGVFYNDLGYTGFFGLASDRKLKKDIKTVDGALTILSKLNPVTYHYDLEKYPNMGLNTEMEYGFIAQEVKQILPQIVREKGLSTNACAEVLPNHAQEDDIEVFSVMDYTRLIPILTKAVQEQQEIIEAQNKKLEELEILVKELQKELNK